MEIGLIYSSKDPKQISTRDFIRKFIKERGILAAIRETDRRVDVPLITIDGCCFSGEDPNQLGAKRKRRFPRSKDIARALEKNFWTV